MYHHFDPIILKLISHIFCRGEGRGGKELSELTTQGGKPLPLRRVEEGQDGEGEGRIDTLLYQRILARLD